MFVGISHHIFARCGQTSEKSMCSLKGDLCVSLSDQCMDVSDAPKTLATIEKALRIVGGTTYRNPAVGSWVLAKPDAWQKVFYLSVQCMWRNQRSMIHPGSSLIQSEAVWMKSWSAQTFSDWLRSIRGILYLFISILFKCSAINVQLECDRSSGRAWDPENESRNRIKSTPPCT